MRHRLAAAVLVLVVLVAAAPLHAQGVAVASLAVTDTSNNSYTAWVGYVDLPKYPALFQPNVRGSACNAPACQISCGTGTTKMCTQYPAITLMDTYTFAQTQPNMLVAVTANTGLALNNYVNGLCATTMEGLIVSNGAVVSPPQYQGPTLYFTSNSVATITSGALPALNTIKWAVAGSTTTNNDCPCGQLGTLLVANGSPGACAVPKSTIPAARGAAGLTKNGILILAIVQGSEGTSGMTTAQFARLMIGLGAYNAVNFDGGGSTAFIWNWNQFAINEETALHSLVTGGGGFTVTPTWQSPKQSQVIYSCVGCNSFRPVYANFGIQFLGG